MASVLHRITKEFLGSVNTPEYPVETWIINPDMTAVIGQPSKYWVITGDTVGLLDQASRDAIDAAELEAGKDAISNTIDLDPYLQAFALVMLDELNNHALKINSILDAIDAASNLATLKTAIGAIADYPERTKAQIKTAVRSKL